MAIISLTSVPRRFAALGDTVATLLAQGPAVREIWLHIPRRYRRFPDWDGTLPRIDRRVRIVRIDEDLGPATKLLPAITELRGTDDQILFCDDDRLYEPDWAARLLAEQARRPDDCVAACGRHARDILPGAGDPAIRQRAQLGRVFDWRYTLLRARDKARERSLSPKRPKPAKPRVRSAGHTEILLGYAGAVVRPRFFDEAVFALESPLRYVDDIWLSGHLARRGVRVWLPERVRVCRRSDNDTLCPLRDARLGGADRRTLNRRAVRFFQTEYTIWIAER
jgi:hypothetical protein